GGVVGAGGDGAAGAVAGPHADTSSMPAHSKPSDGRTQSIGNDPLMEAPDYTIKRRPCSGPEHKKGASACDGRPSPFRIRIPVVRAAGAAYAAAWPALRLRSGGSARG